MAIKENALPVSQSIGSGDYLRKVSSGGVSQQVPFSEVKAAVVTVDPAIDSESENPVQNKAIAAALDAAGTQTQQAIATAIQTEVADRNSAISQAISTEVSNRNTAISEAVAAEAQAREAADEELNQSKANTDGNYPDMTVGNADQLISSIYTEDQTPYNFRQSGGGLSIGDREIDKIVGGTVAWNQLAHNFINRSETLGITIVADNTNGTIHVSGTATATNNLYFQQNIPLVGGHKYLLAGAKPNSGTHGLQVNGFSAKDTGNGAIISAQTSNNHNFVYGFVSGDTIDVTIHPQFIDLTAMFGSAIADYIYSLEQATAGAGVAYFRKLFPKPYYAYNAGELMSVKAASHEMVGFNQWDEELEIGSLDNDTGEPTVTSNSLRSKNFIKVLPDTTYHVVLTNPPAGGSAITRWFIYDEDKNLINKTSWVNETNITMPSNARYVKFKLTNTYGMTYNNDICINLSHNGSRNGEYEPYEKHSYELDANLTLRGIPKLDASNNLYYDGDEYESDGTVNRRYGVVDLGTLNWSLNNTNYMTFFSTGLRSVIKQGGTLKTVMCVPYVTETQSSAPASGDLYIWVNGNKDVAIKDTAKASMTADQFKAAMSGVYLVYELATPTEESAAPYTNPQTVSDWGTEEYVDAAVQEGDRDVAVPVGHLTDYLANLRDKLQNLPDAAGADGTYLVQQTSGQMALLAYTPGVNIPAAPTTDGTYTLQAVVSGGVATYSWVSS